MTPKQPARSPETPRLSRGSGSLKASRPGKGRLFVVATPIGNLEDFTLRAIRTLKEADWVACEDTRRTKVLLEYHGIGANLISYHEYNEMTRAPELVLRMEQGSSIALVSDAGVPSISDPGYRLVKLAIRHGISVVPVPGPSALAAALSVAGLPLDRFRFIGFLPSRRLARQRSLHELAGAEETLIFYESPHRIVEMLEDVIAALGDRPTVVARELTKVHEEFLRGPASVVLADLRKRPAVKGEISVLVGPPDPGDARPQILRESISDQVRRLTADGKLSEREALKSLARSTGASKSALYRQWQMEKAAKRSKM